MSITADPHETSTVVLLSFIGWNQGANYVINTPHTNGKLRLYFPPFSVPNKPFGFCGRKATCLLIYYFHIAYFDRFCHPARQSIPPHFDVFWQDFTIQQDSSFLRILTGFHHPARQFTSPYFTIQQDRSFLRNLTGFHHPARQFISPYFDLSPSIETVNSSIWIFIFLYPGSPLPNSGELWVDDTCGVSNIVISCGLC